MISKLYTCLHEFAKYLIVYRNFGIGKEFVRFRGTTCSKEHQYGNFDNATEAKLACAFDQDCIAFHAIQSGCVEYRQECKNLNESQDDDFRLCKKNSKLKNEMSQLWEYYKITEGDTSVSIVILKSSYKASTPRLLFFFYLPVRSETLFYIS